MYSAETDPICFFVLEHQLHLYAEFLVEQLDVSDGGAGIPCTKNRAASCFAFFLILNRSDYCLHIFRCASPESGPGIPRKRDISSTR